MVWSTQTFMFGALAEEIRIKKERGFNPKSKIQNPK
jgi:hypothetical protein